MITKARLPRFVHGCADFKLSNLAMFVHFWCSSQEEGRRQHHPAPEHDARKVAHRQQEVVVVVHFGAEAVALARLRHEVYSYSDIRFPPLRVNFF